MRGDLESPCLSNGAEHHTVNIGVLYEIRYATGGKLVARMLLYATGEKSLQSMHVSRYVVCDNAWHSVETLHAMLEYVRHHLTQTGLQI